MSFPRGFVRTDVDAEEEITPPATQRVSSFDSLSAATALCSQLPASIAPAVAYDAPARSESPGSPTVAAAAAMLQQVQSSDALEGAVDCLMLMSSHAAAASAETDYMPPPKKRPPPAASSTRRKLKMRTGPSPLSRGSTSDEGSTMQPLALLSSSSVDQLKLLAAAFKLCPSPTEEQIGAIASRVAMEPEALTHWFHQRRVLQEWVQQQPHVSSSSMRSMFYGEGEAAESESAPPSPTESMPPPAVSPWRYVEVVIGS